MSKSKYVVAEQFEDIHELISWVMEGKSLKFGDKTMNSAWVLNQHLQFLLVHFDRFKKVRLL